jgi:hypothetical protein
MTGDVPSATVLDRSSSKLLREIRSGQHLSATAAEHGLPAVRHELDERVRYDRC